MGLYLNSRVPFDSYRAIASERYFVDKTALIAELIPALGTSQRFFCLTRPRRFGKSVMANMIGAFFGKAMDSGEIFGKLQIASPEIAVKLEKNSCKGYLEYLNHYDVIYIDFSRMPENCRSYDTYINWILQDLKTDLSECFPECKIDPAHSIWNILSLVYQKTGHRFVFVLDEWDAVFHMNFITDPDRKEYLLFLKSLLKDNIYAELVYMTGILPIAKYSEGSELNMFLEYHMATTERFSEYFGFSNLEVDRLYDIYQQTTDPVRFTRGDLRTWYDGYYTAGGERM